ncbi:hypothetical protein OC845_000859 [Tilletia horrida]|nr:hypothetical protein OC845_000859 [Tilletia horrida]
MEVHPASLSSESNMSSSPSSSSSPLESPASSASSWDQESDDLGTSVEPIKITPQGGAGGAGPETPLVSILCNPKHGAADAPAGELTKPTIAIPEADSNSSPSAAAGLSGVSPTAAISAIKTVFSKKKSTPDLDGTSSAGGKKAATPALGKSFKRAGPPPTDDKGRIQGAPLLDHDPRSESEDGGESTSSSHSDTTENGGFPASMQDARQNLGTSSDRLPQRPFRDRFGSVPDTHYYGTTSGQAQSQSIARSNSNASSSSYRSESSTGSKSRADLGASPHSIRFCPLPETGRLKRANSITIGIAARSQMLLSQGSGPVPRAQNQGWTNSAAGHHQPGGGGVHPSDPRFAGIQNHRAAAWYEAGGEVPDDVIDVGAELRKVGKLAWRKMRGGGGGGGGGNSAVAKDGNKGSAEATSGSNLSSPPPPPPPPKEQGQSTNMGDLAPAVPSKTGQTANDQWLRASDPDLLNHHHPHATAADGGNDDEADGMKTPRANAFGTGSGSGSGAGSIQPTPSLSGPNPLACDDGHGSKDAKEEGRVEWGAAESGRAQD